MKKTLLISALALLCSATINAKILRVNNNVGVSVDYTDIKDAYEAASDGDTLYIEGSSVSYQMPKVEKSLTFIGPGYLFSENEITNYGQSPATISGVTTIDAANCTLKGLILSGITLNKSDITINRCYIKTSNYSYSIAFESNISNIVIHQNIITNSISGGSSMVGTNCVVTNNIIYSGINYLKNSIIEYNTIITTSKGYLYYLYGNTIRNNMFPSPIFHDMNMLMADNAISNNYEDTFTEYLEGPEYASGKTKFESGCKLKSDSPLLTMSTTGGEIGAFGGTDPYVLSGIPNIPIIKSISASSNANKSDGLSVSIVITTQP